MNKVTELLQPVENDLDDLILELKNLIGAGHPILQAAAEHLFSAGGKRLRPGIVLLISRSISPNKRTTVIPTARAAITADCIKRLYIFLGLKKIARKLSASPVIRSWRGKINPKYPQIAARVITPMTNISNFNDNTKNRIKKYLNLILNSNPSKDVFEVVSKSLN